MKHPASSSKENVIPTVSRRLPDGLLVELVYDPETKHTRLAVERGKAVTLEK
jgi:hypothetical protein